MFSNGNSFSGGQAASPRDIREPWYIRLLSPIRDRGSL